MNDTVTTWPADIAKILHVAPLTPGAFGRILELTSNVSFEQSVRMLEATPDALPKLLQQANGLLLFKGAQRIREEPELLLRLSRLFGSEVEDYRATLTPINMVHEQVPEILVVSNLPPYNVQPPQRPQPPLTADGELPIQFPHRRGWHTDQSYRRPPPDISLFFAAIAAPTGQGQTLYADCISAYETLPDSLRNQVDDLIGIHASPRLGLSESAALAGEPAPQLAPHQRPQQQAVVRTHPETGRRALYLCEGNQMDWYNGPFVGMEPGPRGDGARLLYELMEHITRAQTSYAHNWSDGDLIIYDNRSILHSATWYDANNHQRLMWRTTVWGNPGPEYAGESRSWVPQRSERSVAD